MRKRVRKVANKKIPRTASKRKRVRRTRRSASSGANICSVCGKECE